MSDLLLEIFSEEIPAKMQKMAAENLLKISTEILEKNGLKFDNSQIKTFITPQRLVLYIYRLEQFQITPAIKKFGPKIDANPKAIEGFARSNGVEAANLEQENNVYIFQSSESKIKTSEIIKNCAPQIIAKMVNVWPKLMRFDIEGFKEQGKWIRPIRSLACMLGDEIINFKYLNFTAANKSFTRNLKEFIITNSAHFEEFLEDDLIILNQEKRKQKIFAQINKIKYETGLELIDDENSSLFDEIVGLCQSPTALLASIDEKFLELPDEVLILTLRLNQKYLCLKDKNGNLAAKFIFISNAKIDENNATKIIADNEKVVRARLSDAEFFINEDLKIPLTNRIEDLKKIIFHQKLGSLFDKKNRLRSLARFLSIFVSHCELSLADDAADLCKTDLSSKAIGELPELQGKIGSFYALKQGLDKKLVAAIYEHYLPLGPNSELPKTPLGIALSIADKIDNIVGFFLAGEKPTSSKDPYALRRSVLGIIRIAIFYNINFPIRILVEKSINSYPLKLQKNLLGEKFQQNKKLLIEEIIKFFVERLKIYLKEVENVRADIANVIVSQYLSNLDSHKLVDILYLTKKAKFLNEFLLDTKYNNLLSLYKRSANILVIEEKKDEKYYCGKPNKLLKNKYEKALNHQIKTIKKEFHKLVTSGDFKEACKLLESMELPLKEFFDNVIVNDKDKNLRENRLLILSQIRKIFEDFGDLSQIEIN